MRIPNIILPWFCIIFFYERKYKYPDSQLHAKKDLLTVHEIKKKPFYHDIANCHHYNIPGISNPLTQPFEKPIGCVFPVNKVTRHIDQYGIHADHFKIECPFFITAYIYDIIKQSKKY